MDIKKIKAIVDLVKESGIAELEIFEGEDKLKITAISSAPITHTMPTQQSHIPVVHSAAPQTNPTSVPTEAPAAPVIIGKQITSPMVGTFYKSSSPATKPFVEIGQEVKEGQVLCIIEAMKLMNQIESDQAGIIKEILLNDGAPVEFGQPLFIIA